MCLWKWLKFIKHKSLVSAVNICHTLLKKNKKSSRTLWVKIHPSSLLYEDHLHHVHSGWKFTHDLNIITVNTFTVYIVGENSPMTLS